MSGVLATGAEGRRRAAGVTPYTALRGLNPSEGESDCLEFKLAGPKAGKVSVPPFQRGAGSRGRAPVARRNGRNTFPKGAFYFGSTFLFARKKERWKPCAPCRGRHPGRGAAGLLVTNDGSRLELKSPTGRCQGDARAAHQKYASGMFLRPQKLHTPPPLPGRQPPSSPFGQRKKQAPQWDLPFVLICAVLLTWRWRQPWSGSRRNRRRTWCRSSSDPQRRGRWCGRWPR